MDKRTQYPLGESNPCFRTENPTTRPRNDCNGNDLERQPEAVGADWGAVENENGQPEAVADADLAGIVKAWPTLPEAIRAGIMAMVRAAGTR